MRGTKFTFGDIRVGQWISIKNGAQGQVIKVRSEKEVKNRGVHALVVQISSDGKLLEVYYNMVKEFENPYVYKPVKNNKFSGGLSGL